jgi:hypothetical protein
MILNIKPKELQIEEVSDLESNQNCLKFPLPLPRGDREGVRGDLYRCQKKILRLKV